MVEITTTFFRQFIFNKCTKMPWQRGVVVIISATGTEDRGFEAF
jgi:hypothetical protein